MRWSRLAVGAGIVGSITGATIAGAHAQTEADLLARIEALEQRIAEQDDILARQDMILARQQEELEILRQRGRGPAADAAAGGQPSLAAPPPELAEPSQGRGPSSLSFSPTPGLPPPAEVSQAPDERVGTEPPEEETRPPEIQAIPELGGVLTPRGVLQIEPSIEYTNSAVNRFTFRGIEVVEAVLLGVIEAEDADRDSIRGELTFRYGITNRLEAEAVVPYVYRNDRVTTLVDPAGTDIPRSLTDQLDGMGFGDVEFAGHYQINDGLDDWPFFVGNLRIKTVTGEGPFDIDRDSFGVPTELATGSGFWSIEPSLTVIYPTDPAVLFANVGYNWNIADDIDQRIGDAFIGRVDPGDSVGVSFGLGLGLNERLSMTLGYQHDFIDGTTTEIDGVDFDSNSLDVGSLLFGASYRLSDRIRANLNTRIGVTEDAPDVRVTLRLPISFETPFR